MLKKIWWVFLGAASFLAIGCPTGTGGSDLVVTSVSPAIFSAAVALSTTWPFGAVVTNLSTESSGASTLRFSVTSPFSGATVNLDAAVGPLGPGETATVAASSVSVKLLSDLGIEPGANTVTVIADAGKTNHQYSQAVTLPVLYPRIIVDTYFPTADLATGFNVGFTALDLYDSGGGAPVATDHVGGNPDTNNSGCGYIDYSPPGTAAPGTIYYIKITSRSTAYGGYAIRVLDAPDPNVTAGNQRDSKWYFSASSDDSAFEPDDSQGPPTGTPFASITHLQALNRALSTSSDVDWVKLTLP